jgi:hypothetical protein
LKLLLIDFIVFVVEASTFFALAALFKTPTFYWALAALLTFDALWAGATSLVNPVTKFRWCLLNFCAAAGMVIVLSLDVFKPGMEVWVLTLIVAVRTIVDYSMHWRFYFPFGDDTQPEEKPRHEDVEREAYDLWERDGRPQGRSAEYWSRAEEALRRRGRPNAAPSAVQGPAPSSGKGRATNPAERSAASDRGR